MVGQSFAIDTDVEHREHITYSDAKQQSRVSVDLHELYIIAAQKQKMRQLSLLILIGLMLNSTSKIINYIKY